MNLHGKIGWLRFHGKGDEFREMKLDYKGKSLFVHRRAAKDVPPRAGLRRTERKKQPHAGPEVLTAYSELMPGIRESVWLKALLIVFRFPASPAFFSGVNGKQ